MNDELGSADVAIIGGGLVGVAAAYYLATSGVDVVLVERSGLNREASGTNAGSLHLQIYIHPTFPDDYIEILTRTNLAPGGTAGPQPEDEG